MFDFLGIIGLALMARYSTSFLYLNCSSSGANAPFATFVLSGFQLIKREVKL